MASSDLKASFCYCSEESNCIEEDIVSFNLPKSAYTSPCCWQKICSVRSENKDLISGDAWERIVARRGTIFMNLNPLGQ